VQVVMDRSQTLHASHTEVRAWRTCEGPLIVTTVVVVECDMCEAIDSSDGDGDSDSGNSCGAGDGTAWR